MAIAETQLLELLDKLLARTKSGTLGWSRSTASGSYQTRSGDFVIYLAGDPRSLETMNAISSAASVASLRRPSLTIKRLNGKTVHEIGNNLNSLISAFGNSSSSMALQNKVDELYSEVAYRDDDIEELLKSLG